MSIESQLEAKVRELKEREEELKKEQGKLYDEIYNTEVALAEEQMKNVSKYIPKYEAKLERIRKYVEEFVKNKFGRENITYAFRKVELYKDDNNDPMVDPLNWKIAEYDLLDMDQYIEILFDYHSEAVKHFVKKWMTEHLKYALEAHPHELTGIKH